MAEAAPPRNGSRSGVWLVDVGSVVWPQWCWWGRVKWWCFWIWFGPGLWINYVLPSWQMSLRMILQGQTSTSKSCMSYSTDCGPFC